MSYRESSHVQERYHSLTNWLHWRHRVDRLLKDSALPSVVIGELEAAIGIHGDNLLDLYRDELVEDLHRYYKLRSLVEDL